MTKSFRCFTQHLHVVYIYFVPTNVFKIQTFPESENVRQNSFTPIMSPLVFDERRSMKEMYTPLGLGRAYEELGSVGVGSGVSHGQDPWTHGENVITTADAHSNTSQ